MGQATVYRSGLSGKQVREFLRDSRLLRVELGIILGVSESTVTRLTRQGADKVTRMALLSWVTYSGGVVAGRGGSTARGDAWRDRWVKALREVQMDLIGGESE